VLKFTSHSMGISSLSPISRVFGVLHGITGLQPYALANSFSSALPFRNHDRSRLCIYRGSVRFFARSFCVHSRDSSRRFAVFRKLA